MSRLEAEDILEYRSRPGNISQREVLVERFRINFPRNCWDLEERFNFRRERKKSAIRVVVDRLHAQPVPREQQPAFPAIPDGEGEHAPEMLDSIIPILFVSVENRLGVRLRPECVTRRNQIGSQVAVVVDFGVEYDCGRAIFIENGLLATFQINDAEAAESESYPAFDKEAFVIGPAMRHGFATSLT